MVSGVNSLDSIPQFQKNIFYTFLQTSILTDTIETMHARRPTTDISQNVMYLPSYVWRGDKDTTIIPIENL